MGNKTMTPQQWLISVACSWYLAYAVTKTHGPLGIFDRLREFKGGRWHGRSKVPSQVTISGSSHDIQTDWKWEYSHDGLLDCIICLMPWLALATIWLQTGHIMILEALAVAGISLWIHGYTSWRMNIG